MLDKNYKSPTSTPFVRKNVILRTVLYAYLVEKETVEKKMWTMRLNVLGVIVIKSMLERQPGMHIVEEENI